MMLEHIALKQGSQSFVIELVSYQQSVSLATNQTADIVLFSFAYFQSARALLC